MKIQDKHWFYSLLRRTAFYTFPWAYGKLEVFGRSKIPQDAAVIFAPNHTNALMDALAVLQVDQQPTVFVARADIFRKKTVAKLLTFFKMMPIMRIRDGRDNLKKNDETVNRAVEVLCHKVPFCIMAEGTHRPMHSLLPLVKGIFRIAFEANEKINGKMPIYIVPVGIEYGDYFRYGASLLIQVGDPIDVSQFIEEHEDLELPEQVNLMRDFLSEEMKKLILYIPDDENYEAVLEFCYIRTSKGDKRKTLQYQLESKRLAVTEFEECTSGSPEKKEQLVRLLRQFSELRKKLRIAHETIGRASSWRSIFRKNSFLLGTFPYFVFSLLLSFPVITLSEFFCSKQEDKAFLNSYRYVVNLLLLPFILIATALFLVPFFSWYLVLIVVLLAIPSYQFSHYYVRSFRLLLSEIRYLRSRDLQELFLQVEQFVKTTE